MSFWWCEGSWSHHCGHLGLGQQDEGWEGVLVEAEGCSSSHGELPGAHWHLPCLMSPIQRCEMSGGEWWGQVWWVVGWNGMEWKLLLTD